MKKLFVYSFYIIYARVPLYREKKTKKKTFSSLIKNPITKVYKNETHDRINCLSWKKWYCWNIWIFNFNIATTLEDRRQFSRATLIFFFAGDSVSRSISIYSFSFPRFFSSCPHFRPTDYNVFTFFLLLFSFFFAFTYFISCLNKGTPTSGKQFEIQFFLFHRRIYSRVKRNIVKGFGGCSVIVPI